ncbi:MAG TPA: alpha/beta fold hydrolase [Steroidobacteraceae bacterium]|nr:alpha/beta fold hydrolase [Steroidobacteraceae bacterium]
MSLATRPFYFKSGRQSLFGWLHQPEEGRRSDLGIVICKPFGYEAMCAHRSIRAFADACASAGATVLRFDYTGTGDSSGSDTDTNAVNQWCDDIRTAMDALRLTGVTRFGLLGIRFGALLASVVAGGDPSVEHLIAVAPVVSGRRHLRELRTFQATASAEEPADESNGAMEVAGFHLSKASVERLAQLDLLGLPATIRSALILDREDLPGARAWADALLERGTPVQYRALPGFLEMVATPHAAQIPLSMVSATVEYLSTAARSPVPRKHIATAADDGATSMRLMTADGARLVERAMFVDEARTLFAITTELENSPPRPRAPHAHGVVMLNGGATSHIGPNRMYVELARRWAASGYVVLRLDLAGLGDSATRPGQNGNEVYPPGALDDVSAAINFLRREFGVEQVTLAGLCAGAYHALRSAISGLHVNTVLLVNPLTFYWRQGSKLSDLQEAEVVANPGIYAEKIFSFESWRKVMSGRVNLWRVFMVFLRRAMMTAVSTVRDLSRLLRIKLPRDLGWELQSLASRGVRIVFLFARGDVGQDLLRMQGGSAVKSIGDRCRVHVIEGADHIFSQGAARKKLLQLLTNELPR